MVGEAAIDAEQSSEEQSGHRGDGEEVECRRPSLRAFVEDLDEAVACVDGENLRCTVTAESPCAVPHA
jgi:hypothetical protein